MYSLAQAIIDTAHNMRTTSARNSRLRDDYFQATQNASTKAALAALSHRLSKDIPLIAPLVKKSLRYSIDQSVADAIVKMAKTPTETLVQAFKYARPAHNPLWVEFDLPEGDLKVGWLIEHRDNALHVHHVRSESRLNHSPMYVATENYGIAKPEGLFLGSKPDPTWSSSEKMRFKNLL